MTTIAGTVLAISQVSLGDVLAADATAGDTTITVDDAADFAEGGGTILIGGQLDDYTSVDDETGVMVLVDALLADALQGDRVDLADPAGSAALEWQALVAPQGTVDTDEAIQATINYAIVPLLPEGIRDPGTGESVTLTRDGTEWQVTNVHGQQPTLESDNVATGGFLIAAQPPGDVITPDNTLEASTTYRMPRYSGNDVVFAYGKAGDSFPQIQFFGSMGQGIYFGDGTSDPASGSINLFVENAGLVLGNGGSGLQMTTASARLSLSATAQAKAILRADSEASLTMVPATGQTVSLVLLTQEDAATPVLTVEPDGTVELHGAGVGIVMASPDGTRYRATIANGGTWSIAPA